jgi:3-hydroxybutyryl-CoA dehydrogenase
MLEIETIAVFGAGHDAVRTALLCSLAGLEVRLSDARPQALDGAFRELRHEVDRALAAGILGHEERQRILDGILLTSSLDEAATGADLAFVAEPTEPAAARLLLWQLAASCRATALLATAADPAALGPDVPQPGRIVGLALEKADGSLPRLRVVTGPATTGHARARAVELAERVDRAAGGRD